MPNRTYIPAYTTRLIPRKPGQGAGLGGEGFNYCIAQGPGSLVGFDSVAGYGSIRPAYTNSGIAIAYLTIDTSTDFCFFGLAGGVQEPGFNHFYLGLLGGSTPVLMTWDSGNNEYVGHSALLSDFVEEHLDTCVVIILHEEEIPLALLIASYKNIKDECLLFLSGYSYSKADHIASIYQPDYLGFQREFKDGEVVWRGGRVVRNEIAYSEDFSNSEWTQLSVDTEVEHGILDPNGGYSASRLTQPAEADAGYFRTTSLTSLDVDNDATFSVWMRTDDGSAVTAAIGLEVGYNSGEIVTVTGDWQLFATRINRTVGPTFRAGVGVSPGTSIDISFANFNITTNNPDVTTPSEYIKTTTAAAQKVFATTNGNTVDGDGIVTEAPGVPLDPPPLMHYQDALENLVPYSRDLTQWTNDYPTTYDQIGVTGDPNTASLLTNDGTGVQPPLAKIITQAPLNSYSVLVALKRDLSAGARTVIYLSHRSLVPETSNIALDITDGSFEILDDPTSSIEVNVELIGDFYYMAISCTPIDVTNDTVWVSIRPVAGETITVGYAGYYENTTIEQLINAGPIFTEGTALATDRIDYEHSVENISNESFAMYMECEPEGAGLIAGCFLGYGIGEELYTNWDFKTDLADWALTHSGDSTSNIYWESGGLRLISDGTTAAFSQPSLTIGDSVLMAWDITEINGTVYTYNAGVSEQQISTPGLSNFTIVAGAVAVSHSRLGAVSALTRSVSARQLSATAYPSFRLTDRAGNTITAPATVSTRHKIGIVANAEEALMDIYLDGLWAGETPYSGTLHDDLLDMFRLNEYPGGVWNHRTWKGGTLAELKAKVEEQVPMPTYIPIETSPDWETVGGTNPTQVNLLDGVVTQVGDTNPEQAIAYKDYNLADVEVSCIIHHENPSNNIMSFFLAVRMSSVDDAIGLRGYNGIIEIYDRIGGTFTSLLTATPSNAGTIGTRMSLRVKGTQVSAIVDGVEYIAETPTALTASGRVGFLSRGNTLGTVPMASHYLVSEI